MRNIKCGRQFNKQLYIERILQDELETYNNQPSLATTISLLNILELLQSHTPVTMFTWHRVVHSKDMG